MVFRGTRFDTCHAADRARMGHIPRIAVLRADAILCRSRATLVGLSIHHWQVARGTELLQLTKFRVLRGRSLPRRASTALGLAAED